MSKARGLLCCVFLCCSAAAFLSSASAATKVKLSYTASTAHLSAYIAKDQGFFDKYGLDVTLEVASNGSVIIAGTVANSVQIGTPTPSVYLQAVANGIDQVVLAAADAFPETAHMGVLVRSGEIKTAQDLVGRKVGVPGIGGILDVVFRKWVSTNGVDPKRVVYIETTFSQMGDLLKAKQVDAVLAIDPFYPRILETQQASVLADPTQALPAGTIGAVFTATGQWAAANAEAVAAFQQALSDGVAFGKSHPAEARESMARYTKLPPAVVASLPIPNMVAKVMPEDLRVWAEICREQGLIDTIPDTTKLVLPWRATP
jgi:NitT/TauT family transport system substrate-binding protein